MQPETPDEITDLLVAYALGALESTEMERIGRLLAERPDLRVLLADLKATAGMLPYGLPVSTPPLDLRQRVLDHAVGRAPRTAATPTAELGLRLRGWLYAFGGLAVATLVALAFTLFQLGGARAELAQARQQLAESQQQIAAVERQVAALSSERSEFVQALASAETISQLAGPGGVATVLQAADGQLLLAAQLPPLTSDQVYQLWVIAGTSAPASGGVFSVDSSGFGVIALGAGTTAAGVTLAVTAEPAPGSAGPTLPILLAGELL